MAKKEVIRKKAKPQQDPVVKQKLIWTVGHVMTLTCGLIFTGACLYNVLFFYRHWGWSRLLPFSNHGLVLHHGIGYWVAKTGVPVAYRLALVGVLLSHGVTTWQNWARLNPTYYDLLSKDNFQNLLIATLWLFSRSSFYKLVPFIITSYLHLTKKQNASDEETTKQNSMLLHLIAYSELVVLFSLMWDTLLFRGASGFALVFYTAIYWLKLNFSPYVQTTVLRILSKLKRVVPASQRERWDSVQDFLLRKLREQQVTQEEARKRL
ncbi:AaceriABR032Wp [[Ashbya] aceris (nom. inval.)]|nr:AaceriABR032Wp [[Ashbya] aceris (nom. inval.)]